MGGVIFSIIIAVLGISWFEWSEFKKKPKRDRVVFVSLLLLVLMLSIWDLPNTPGPTTFLHFIFKPLAELME